MAKKKSKKVARRTSGKVSAKRAAKRAKATRKPVKTGGKSATQKHTLSGKGVYRCRGLIHLHDGEPYCRIPAAGRRTLGSEDDIPVLVAMLGATFYAVLRPAKRTASLFMLDPTEKHEHLEFFLYRDVRSQLDLRPGQTVDVALKREPHATGKRGKLLR